VLKDKGHPQIAQQIRGMERAEADGREAVVVRLAPGRSRDLPLIIATLPIFSARYYATRSFEESTMEPPLGSGPYKVARVDPGRSIEFARVADYWGKDLAVNVGQSNFDRMRYEYYRDREAAFQAFTAGQFTFREEFTSLIWVSRYDFPALKDGRVKKEAIPDETPSGAQGWFINTRRDKFKDRRVREALINAFDFEWTNATIMYGQYARVASFFENSPMKAAGKPSPEELALLEPFRGKVPDEVFGEPYLPPVSDGSGQDRGLLRRAAQLLQDAGLKRGQDGLLRLANGEPFSIEFLDDEGSLERHTNPFIKNLRLIGIDARFRIVDPAQYQRRLEDFDFDLTVRRYSLSPTPGEAMRQFWGSEAAATRGSFNLSGIADPALDVLVETALKAKSRAELTTACLAIDRVLRAGRYWVPMWHKPSHWLSYWDVFGRPAVKPKYDRGAPATWWYDEGKAKLNGKAG
jgi:microcin C transport system substrate-binding protein